MTQRPLVLGSFHWAALAFATVACSEPTASGNTLTPLWHSPLQFGAAFYPAPVRTGNSVIALAGSILVSYDAGTGALQWHSDSTANHPRIGAGENIAVDGALAVAGNAEVAGIDLNTHAVRWRATPSSLVQFSNVLVDSLRAYTAGMNGDIQAWDVTTGALVWTNSLATLCPFTCTTTGMTFLGDTVFTLTQKSIDGFASHIEAIVVALSRTTGLTFWSWQSNTSGNRSATGAPTVAGSMLIMSDFLRSRFYAFSRATRSEVWSVSAPSNVIGPAEGPLVSGDTVYAADLGGNVYAVDLVSGRQLWRQNVGTGVQAIQLCNGRLFLQNFSLIALRASDGGVIGSYRAPDGLFASRIGKGANVVYVASDQSVYAFPCQ